jgi:hypothetical protein
MSGALNDIVISDWDVFIILHIPMTLNSSTTSMAELELKFLISTIFPK